MGSLFKQIYRYTHRRAFRHNENLWPFTHITRAASGEIRTLKYKGKTVPLVNLSELKDSAEGEVPRRAALILRGCRKAFR